MEDGIRWEDPRAELCGERGGEGMFPHLYKTYAGEEDGREGEREGDREFEMDLTLGKEVEGVAVWVRDMSVAGDGDGDGMKGWGEAVRRAEEAGWLVY